MPRGINGPRFKTMDDTPEIVPMDAEAELTIPRPPEIPIVPPVFAAQAPAFEVREIKTTPELTAGAQQILEYLPETEAALVREISEMLEVPIWQVLAGYVMRCRELGVLQSPIILAEWQDSRSPRSIRECRACGTEFQPSHWGQPYCSQECGVDGERRGLNR